MSQHLLRLTVIAACAVALGAVLVLVRQRRKLADETVQSIEEQVRALDPVTRAVVVARLAADAKAAVTEQRD
jgi:hypothetical protein